MLLIDNGGRCYLTNGKNQEFIGWIEHTHEKYIKSRWRFLSFDRTAVDRYSLTRDDLIAWVLAVYAD